MIARSNVGMYFTVLVCECAKCGAFGVTISHIARQFWAQKKIDKRPRLMPKIIKEGTNVEQSKNYCLYLKPKVRLIRIEMWFCTNSAREVLTIFGWYREPGWIRWLCVSVCVWRVEMNGHQNLGVAQIENECAAIVVFLLFCFFFFARLFGVRCSALRNVREASIARVWH